MISFAKIGIDYKMRARMRFIYIKEPQISFLMYDEYVNLKAAVYEIKYNKFRIFLAEHIDVHFIKRLKYGSSYARKMVFHFIFRLVQFGFCRFFSVEIYHTRDVDEYIALYFNRRSISWFKQFRLIKQLFIYLSVCILTSLLYLL